MRVSIDTTYTAPLLADEELKRLAVAIDDEEKWMYPLEHKGC